jgi:hypothetical protein
MTASAKARPRDAPLWSMAPSLRRMGWRHGDLPRLTSKWPCLQMEQASPGGYIDRLALSALELPGVEEEPPPLDVPGRAFALDNARAKGQPESYIFAPIWLIIRLDGSAHLTLRPEWA